MLTPVTRPRLQRFQQGLAQLTMKAASDPAQGVRRAPVDMLAAMVRRRPKAVEATARDAEANARLEAANAETSAWRAAWAEAVAALPVTAEGGPLLWYVRRRAVAYRSNVTGIAVPVSGDDVASHASTRRPAHCPWGEARIDVLRSAATPFAAARMAAFLGAPRMLASDLLLIAGVHDLEQALPPSPQPEDGEPLPVPAPTPGPVSAVRTDLLSPRLAAIASATTRPGLERLAASRLSLSRALAAPVERQRALSEGDVLDVASDYGYPALGEGLARLTHALEATLLTKEQMQWLGDSGQVLALDRAGRVLGDDALAPFAARLHAAAAAKNADDLAALIAGQD